MVVLSLLPVGLLQTWASVEHGYWYARSSEFMQTTTMHALRWARVPGDTLFAAGIVSLVLFVAGLGTGHSIQRGKGWSPSTGGLGPDTREPLEAE
jgi:nitric oxide reductase subunit B